MSRGRRVLVATQERTPPLAALEHAAAAAGEDGEVVLAAVLVIPLAQKLGASLDRSVSETCAVLEAGERAAHAIERFDTRLVRARSFAEGVLETLEAERFRPAGGRAAAGPRARRLPRSDRDAAGEGPHRRGAHPPGVGPLSVEASSVPRR